MQTAQSWPEFAFDAANTGHNPDGTGPVENVGGQWVASAGGRTTVQPVVADGVVYLPSQNGQIYAFDPVSGDSVDGWPVDLGSSIGSVPAIVDGTLYVGDDSGTLHAVDTAAGEELWRFGTDGRIDTPPAVADGTVYVGSTGGGFFAIDISQDDESITERWSFDTGEEDNRAISSGAAVGSVETEDGPKELVVFGTDSSAAENASLFALEVSSGDEVWSRELRGPVTSTPTIADGSVFVGTGVDGDPQGGLLYNIEAATGSPRGRFNARGRVVGSPAVADGRIYVGSRNGLVYAVNAETGSQEWRFSTGTREIASSPAVVDGTVYVTSRNNVAYGLTTDGEELWSFETAGSQFASPAVANGVVYIPTVDSTESSILYALGEGGDISSGSAGGADNDSENISESPFETGGNESDFAFLIIPALVGGFATLVAGIAYAVIRSGLPEKYAVDEAPVERLYEDEEESPPGYDDRTQSGVWEVVVGDVIKRAELADKTATQDVIISKYLDDTLDSPVTAFEIESARSDPARVRITEPFVDADLAAENLSEQPLNEGWTIDDSELVFETTLGPGETLRTMVGRQDCPDDAVAKLEEKPTISIESVDA
ncbi:PQQ-binding-like beta-propeller repeat protein [Natrialbaceae archaeon GCM10025896]